MLDRLDTPPPLKPAARHGLQALFWSGYGAVSLFVMSIYLPMQPMVLVILVTLVAGLWAASETLRAMARRHGWLDNGRKLALALLILVPVLALGVQLLVHLTLHVLFFSELLAKPPGSDTRPSALLSYWVNTVIMLALWTAGWLGVHYFRRFRLGEVARWRAEAERQTLELDGLKARLNPHFVFNALNNLRALINEDTEAARDAVTRLSNTLRYALYHSQKPGVSLREELNVVHDHLALEQLHYEGRLRVAERIEPAALDAVIPPMLLQLLVENAIKHGISRLPTGGEIDIAAHMRDGVLTVTVSNPGTLHNEAQDEGGVGIAYLKAGLARLGRKAGFVLEQAGAVVTARMEIPQ